MSTCRSMILLASEKCSGMAPPIAALEWKDIGSLGRTGRGGKEGMSPSMSGTSWGYAQPGGG